MTSISQVEQDEDIELFDTDPWYQQLDLQWEKCFERCEPLTKDKVIQVDVSDQAHPKTHLYKQKPIDNREARPHISHTGVYCSLCLEL